VSKLTGPITKVRKFIVIDGGTSQLYKKELLRIVFPAILTILLFVVTLFAVALPVFKHNLLAQKKTLIAAEVHTVLSSTRKNNFLLITDMITDIHNYKRCVNLLNRS